MDHASFDKLLSQHVDEDGWVDYRKLEADTSALDRYIESLRDAPLDALGRDEKLAILINAYNAFTLRLILDHYPLKSIMDIPASKRWKDPRWILAGRAYSLDDIEHKLIRPKFNEPRIHFALVCAAVGCPKLRNQAYGAEQLERQLEAQARYVHAHDRWFRFDRDAGVVYLTKLYDWYGGDFEEQAGSVLAFAARYAPPLAKALQAKRKPEVRWLDYDWTLNDNLRAP